MKSLFSFILFLFINVLLVSAAPTTGLQFNGSAASYINCGYESQFSPVQFTLEAWVNFQAFNGADYIMSNEGWPANCGQGFTLHASNSKIEFVIGSANAQWTKLQSKTNIALSTWYHVAVTYNSTTMSIYINGVLDNTLAITSPIVASTQSLSIGEGSTWKGRLMTGQLADVRLWSVVRTASQISGSMSSSLTGTETGLVADWKMNEGTGLTVGDATGNYPETITNALYWFTPTTTGPIRVVCVGNSITAGFMTSNPAIYAYPEQLGNLLGGGYSVLNCGVSGCTMLKNGDSPYENQTAYTTAKNFDPQIVIISLGTNDSKGYNWGVYGSQFYSDYASMIADFRSTGHNPHIFVCFPPPAFIYNQYNIMDSTLINSIQPLVDSIRTTLGTSKIDYYHPLLPYCNLFADGIHPTDAGSLMMAQIAYKAITTNVGVTSVKSPLSKSTLTSNEQLTITINNNNPTPLVNVPVAYKVDNNTEVKEVIPSIPANTEINYKFVQQVDFSQKKDYSVKVYTSITNQPPYDTLSVKITNFNANADYAMKFGGTNGEVVVPNSASLMPLSAFTLEAWIYPTQFASSAGSGTVISKESNTGGYALDIGGNGSGRIVIVGGNKAWIDAIIPDQSIILNQWSHIAGVYDGTNIYFYVNGVLKATTSNVGAIQPSTSQFWIGGSSAFSGRVFNGGIDEVSIWNRALSPTEIIANKGFLLKGNENGLVAYYNLNQTPGTQIVTDLTGNGNNGTIQNLDIYTSWMYGAGLVSTNSTGVSQTKIMLGVSIYTDPTRDFLFVKSDSKNINLNLVITDLMGRTVLNNDIKNAGSEIKVNIQNYVKGLYILTLRSDSESISTKIIL